MSCDPSHITLTMITSRSWRVDVMLQRRTCGVATGSVLVGASSVNLETNNLRK
jgi:hypothetical protein